jgi:hypothetical protein
MLFGAERIRLSGSREGRKKKCCSFECCSRVCWNRRKGQSQPFDFAEKRFSLLPTPPSPAFVSPLSDCSGSDTALTTMDPSPAPSGSNGMPPLAQPPPPAPASDSGTQYSGSGRPIPRVSGAGAPLTGGYNPQKVYIGNLPETATLADLEDCFGQIGQCTCSIKRGFGFVVSLFALLHFWAVERKSCSCSLALRESLGRRGALLEETGTGLMLAQGFE